MGHVLERASAQYSTNTADLLPNVNVYAFRSFSLATASARILSIAKAYQFYRIKRITWEVRPAYDTFTNADVATVPHLYWRVDRDATFNTTTTLATLKSSGCKPIRLDDKMVRKSYKPAVLQAVAYGPGSAPTTPALTLGTKRISPWLPTDAGAYSSQNTWTPSTVDHNGLLIGIEQNMLGAEVEPSAYISFTIEYEFKKPLEIGAQGPAGSLTEVQVETLAPGYVKPEVSV